MLIPLSCAKTLRDSRVSRLLSKLIATSPLPNARWAKAAEVAQLPLICEKQIEVVKQYTGFLFPVPDAIEQGPKVRFGHMLGFLMCRCG